MKKLCSALSYQWKMYIRSNRYVMPSFAFVIMAGLMYSVVPVSPVDSYSMTAVYLFFAMVWAGFTYSDVQDPIQEQLLILKWKSPVKHYASQSLFLLLFGMLLGLGGVLLPLGINAINSGRVYSFPVTPAMVISAFVLHVAMAFLGGAIGAFFHPRMVVIGDRRLGLLQAFVVAVLGIAKIGIRRMAPWMAAVDWLFPPVGEVGVIFAGKESFPPADVLRCLAAALAYGLVVTGVRIGVLTKKGFD